MIYFNDKLNEIYKNNSELFTQNVGLGLIKGLRVKDADTLAAIIKSAFECGVLVLKAGKNTLRLLPPLTISKEEMNEGFKRLQNALDKIK
jgi:acetylornithine aminotransferase